MVAPAAALSGFHLEEQFAFTNTCVDFCGLLFVKSGADERAQMNKVHIALFTCCRSRAVHADLVPDLTTEAFLRCFKHFTCRRRIPHLIVLDNAKIFRSSAKKLCALFELPKVLKLFSELKIKWKFNLERAPWWGGGFFKRMIHSLKRCLKNVLKNARLTYEELLTIVTEIELVLNSRPLTYLHFDDAEEPLTPSHLVASRRLMTLSEDCAIKEEKESDTELLTRRQRYLILLLSYFWNRWRNGYVLSLREHHCNVAKRNNAPVIAVGDIVTVMAENKSYRGSWKLAKVKEVIQGTDGEIRGARVHTSSAGGRSMVMSRPLQKLFLLEVRVAIEETAPELEGNDNVAELRRPRRVAAADGEWRRRYVDQCLNQDV